MEQTAELVADQIDPILATEFRGLPEHERAAAVGAVRSTFEAAGLTDATLFAQDLDAGYLDRYLRKQDPNRVARAGLSVDAVPLYDLLLREGCAYTIELARSLPGAGMAALAEVLCRERQLLEDMRTVLERLPARRGLRDFARDYRQLVAGWSPPARARRTRSRWRCRVPGARRRRPRRRPYPVVARPRRRRPRLPRLRALR